MPMTCNRRNVDTHNAAIHHATPDDTSCFPHIVLLYHEVAENLLYPGVKEVRKIKEENVYHVGIGD